MFEFQCLCRNLLPQFLWKTAPQSHAEDKIREYCLELSNQIIFSHLWRVADRAGIPLTAGRETMGRDRLSAERRAAVIEAYRANPQATQAEIARATGVSRASVSRIEGGRRCKPAGCQS
jgi:hypothetical protein